MNRDVRIKQLGALGESINRVVLQNHGHKVIMSENRFDRQKDMMADDQTVETKTLCRWVKYNAFALPFSQWKKCDEVDRLFFVEIPFQNYGGPIHIWESLQPRKFLQVKDLRYYEVEHLHLYDTVIDSAMSIQLYELSPSKYKGKL